MSLIIETLAIGLIFPLIVLHRKRVLPVIYLATTLAFTIGLIVYSSILSAVQMLYFKAILPDDNPKSKNFIQVQSSLTKLLSFSSSSTLLSVLSAFLLAIDSIAIVLPLLTLISLHLSYKNFHFFWNWRQEEEETRKRVPQILLISIFSGFLPFIMLGVKLIIV